MLALLPIAVTCLLAGPGPVQDPPQAQDPPVPGDARAPDPAAEDAATQDSQLQGMDRVTLLNGDQLRGKLVDFTDGTLIFNTDVLGDLEIPLEKVVDLSTADPIVVVTNQRTHVEGRILGIVGDSLQMAVDEGNFTAVALADWDAMRFPGGRPAKWRGSISIGGRVSTGNTEERRINASVNFRRRTDIDRVIGDFSYFYDEDFNAAAGKYQLDEKRGNASMQYEFFLGPEAYAWGVAQWSTDSEAEVARRLILGAGGGYQFAESETFNLEGLLGITYYEKIYDTPEPTLAYAALRLGYNVNWEFLRDARFIQSLQALPSLEDPNEDFYLRADTRLRFTFWQGLFTEVQWILDYDTAPAMGRERMDSLVFFNVGYSF